MIYLSIKKVSLKKDVLIWKRLVLKKQVLIRNAFHLLSDVYYMKALCMITVKPGMVDKVVQILRKKRKISKDIMVVTGRADISVILNSSIDEINNVVIDFVCIINEFMINIYIYIYKM